MIVKGVSRISREMAGKGKRAEHPFSMVINQENLICL